MGLDVLMGIMGLNGLAWRGLGGYVSVGNFGDGGVGRGWVRVLWCSGMGMSWGDGMVCWS